MNHAISVLGNIAGTIGVFLCLAAGLIRLLGNYHILGYELRTLFLGGIALMVMACLTKLHLLTRVQRR